MDAWQREGDAEEDELVERQVGLLEKQQCAPDAGANRASLPANAQPATQDGAECMGKPVAASRSAGREKLSWSNFVGSSPEGMLHAAVSMLRQMPDMAREPLVWARLDPRLKHAGPLLDRNSFALQLAKGTWKPTGGHANFDRLRANCGMPLLMQG